MSSTEEYQAQVALVAWLGFRGIGYFAVPNGASLGTRRGVSAAARGKSAAIQMTKLKREGLLPGAPDLILMDRCRCCDERRPIAIEMKSAKGRASKAQLEVHAAMESAGWHVIVGRGFPDTRAQVEWLGL